MSLFHRFAYIYKPLSGGQWVSAKEEWKLTDSEILKAVACVHPRFFIGTRAGRATWYAVLDIDAGSKYHNLSSLKKITDLLAKAGIEETNFYRSSDSGGWHLYIFFDSPISSKDLRNQLVQLLTLHGFEVAKGTLEVFPHPGQKSLGQGLRLPLQPGWAWLNSETLAVRQERLGMSPVEALQTFVRDIESSANTYHQFHQLKAFVEKLSASRQKIVNEHVTTGRSAKVIPIRNNVYPDSSEEAVRLVRTAFQKLPPGIICDRWARGRTYYQHGLTGPSQRADAINCLSHYLFYGDPEWQISPLGYGYETERRWAIEEILKAKHNDYSKDMAAGRPEAIKQIERATSWVPPARREQESSRYESTTPISWIRNNANRLAGARKRIADAVAQFTGAQQPFSMRELRLKAGCSATTLYKHQDLWRAEQDRMNQKRFASDPHEYNAGVGAASQESQPRSPVSDQSMPPGRLAARRIIFELSRRAALAESKRQSVELGFSAGYSKRWAESVRLNLPGEVAGVAELKASLAILRSLVSQSPSYEEEQWLLQHLEAVHRRLADLQIAFCRQHGLDPAESENLAPFEDDLDSGGSILSQVEPSLPEGLLE